MTNTLAPHFHDAVAVQRLSGLSGAEVLLATRDNRHWFIRKAAQDPRGSDRLRRQAAKQLQFAEHLPGVVRTPRILDEGEIEGRYYFDMEFIRGADGASFLRRASYSQVADFSRRLCDYLTVAASKEPLRDNPATAFDAMYAKVCEAQGLSGCMSDDTLAKLFLGLQKLRRIGELQPTLCHGDLTLENMVVDEQGEIWVLDLLDSPFEHYWQDIAKLHQDLAGQWYLTRHPPIAKCVLEFLSRQIMQTAERLQPQYREVHWLLVAATFVRILPYAPDAEKLQFVCQRIEHFANLANGSPTRMLTSDPRTPA
jgi:aminoglycoside phosphotransferase (APT) family kinase protein